MNLVFTILGLIISIMALENKKILLVIKIGLIILISTKTYLLLFGDYYLWRDSDWTDINIYSFYSNGQLYRCIISIVITFGFFYLLLPYLIRFLIGKIKPFYNIDSIKLYLETTKIKLVKNITNKVISVYKYEAINKNGILKEASLYISIFTQLVISWSIITPKITFIEYIIYFVFSILFLLLFIIIPNIDNYFNFIKTKADEYNRNIE